MSSSKYNLETAKDHLTALGYDATLRLMGCSGDALRAAFSRAGMPSPITYTPEFRRAKTPTDPMPVNISGLDYDEDAPTNPCVAPAAYSPQITDAPPADRAFVEPPSQEDVAPLDVGSSELERVLIIPDTHRPYHDKWAWSLLLKAAREFQPHTVAFIGDFADCFTVSDHDKDPRRGTQLVDELQDVNEGLDEVAAVGAQRTIFVAGNHEYRIERYVTRNAAALLGMPGMTIPEMLKINERGWRYVPYMSHIRLGKLYLTHDVGHAGMHAAHHTGAAFGHNVAFGHTHRLQVLYSGGVTGERRVAAALGWLGSSEEARYMPEAKRAAWQHGFGLAHIERSGIVHLQGVPIVGRACVVNGRRVSL